ncbi:holin [Micromonospora sp. NPDC049048]|uniref:holin n=1 Tax=Micromonospora sp. NPDC049048 TaxID=3364263 RepID=UPI00370F8687
MKPYLATRQFWAGAVERAGRAATWTFVAALGVPGVGDAIGVNVRPLGWRDALTLAAGAAVTSVAASVVAGKTAGPAGSPSLVNDRPAEPTPAPVASLR